MNVNFGIISPLGYRVKGKRNKNAEISKRSLEIIDKLMTGGGIHAVKIIIDAMGGDNAPGEIVKGAVRASLA